MTLEHLYKQDLDTSAQQYIEKSLAPLSNFTLPEIDESNILNLLSAEKTLISLSNDLNAVTVPPFSYNLSNVVDDHFSRVSITRTKEKNRLLDERENAKKNAEAEYERKVQEQHNYNESLINPFREKHEKLLQYKDKLTDICARYNISPLDMCISDTITQSEFETLIDQSLSICEQYDNHNKGLFDKIIAPLKGESNLQFTLCYIGLALALIYFTLPILSVGVFTLMIMATHGMYKDLEKLKLAVALMCQIDYNRFVENEKLAPPDRPDLAAIDAEYEEKLNNVKPVDEERKEANHAVISEGKNVEAIVANTNAEVQTAYAKKKKEVEEALKKVREIIEHILKDYKPFPTVQSESVVMSHQYTLGRIEDRLDVAAVLPQANIVFDGSDYENGINLIKLYLCNALLAVRVKQLIIDIFDPKGLCRDFAEFFNADTSDYIRANNKKLEAMLEEFRGYSQANIQRLDHKDIDTFNKEAEEQEMIPLSYRLLIIISEFDSLRDKEKGNVFKEYFKYSAESGVMIWILDKSKWAGALWVDGSYQIQEGRALEYTMDLGYSAVKTFTTSLAKFKDRGIAYAEKFANKYIPEDKWWTFDTIKGIDLHFGLQDGKPTEGNPVTLGDGNVHGIMGGATGAGKSATLNQMIVSLICMYPPSELMLIFVDFKNVEAAKFTGGYDREIGKWMDADEERKLREDGTFYTRLSRIPHLKIISGTTDGEYALSVFEFLMAEMQRRQQLINVFGVTKIQEMREQILEKYNTEHNGDPKKGTWADMRKDWDWYKPNVYDKYGDLPRLLVIFDEFQVMYNTEFVPQKIIDQINGKITAVTKLARAMGCHLFFTSQSMRGTMSADTMANFSLRCALRSTSEVSTELLGNAAASTITAKVGYIYTNDSAGQDKKANKFWRVPYLDEKNIPDYVNKLNDMCSTHNEEHRMAEFYDEKILVPGRQLDSWFNSSNVYDNPGDFILGERAGYSINKAPVTTSLFEDTGENILIAAFERDDVLNLTMTLIVNLLHKKDTASIVMSVMDKDAYQIMDVPSLLPEELVELAGPDQDVEEFIETLEDLVDIRNEQGGPYKPIYVFCVMWENAPGISVNENSRLQDRLKELLRRAPKVGVHFIFSFRNKPQAYISFIPGACSHRIAGLLTENSNWFIDCYQVEKLPSKAKDCGLFAIYKYGTEETKLRIYQHTFKGKPKTRGVVVM